MERVSIQSIVEAVNDLPSLPHVAVKVMKLTEDPDSTAEQINNVLNEDQSMTARVLRLANSAYYGFPRRIATVTDAIIFLGFKTIRGIVLAASVSDMLSQEMEGYALAPGELWRHSQCTALTARLIARNAKFNSLDLAYTAALLHDIGKVIINSHLKKGYQEVIDRVSEGNIPFIEAEDEVLGFNHALVGARVGEKWNLPSELVEAIALHHYPERAEINKRLTSIVHVADALCLTMGIGLGVDGMMYSLSPEAMKLLGLDENSMETMVAQLSDMLVDQQSF
ncbi:MAG TPA: HDOD domain-containing protein [Syntrophomonadaceae bacterium]|nr:HDOD domain-containing protein [Syntrophomonadaceae bacterium]